jgi:hypothetical protein
MKKRFISILLIASCSVFLYAENNSSVKTEENTTSSKTERANKQIEKQMEREKKFAREQQFYKGKDHDLSYAEINKESIDSVPLIEPDYDFDMDDVYD